MKVKEVTIYDIADRLNISSATVSRALKDDPVVSKKTKKKIFELAEKMGYRPNRFARDLRKGKTNTIGFMVPKLNSNFINSVLSGVESVTTEAGYDLIIAHSSESYAKEVANASSLFYKRVDGLIASLSFDTKDTAHFRPFIDKGVPVVFFDRVIVTGDSPTVIIDNYKSGYDATQHLVEQGCRRIAHVTSSLTRNVYSERYRGYRNALKDNKIGFNERLLIINDLSEEAAIGAAQQVAKMKPMPDGAFITNDFVAAIFMKTLKELGVAIPKDLAVVGFNNDIIGRLVDPELTTINYPGREIGEVAAKTLIDHLSGGSNVKKIQSIVLNSSLVIRKSSVKK